MAESVDALVSNTSGATHPGSSPGPGTQTADNLMVVCRFFISTAIKGQHLHQYNKRFALLAHKKKDSANC